MQTRAKEASMANYNDDSIRTMEGMKHIRLRPGMYIGGLGNGTDPRHGIYTLLKEVIDNSVDEFTSAGRWPQRENPFCSPDPGQDKSMQGHGVRENEDFNLSNSSKITLSARMRWSPVSQRQLSFLHDPASPFVRSFPVNGPCCLEFREMLFYCFGRDSYF